MGSTTFGLVKKLNAQEVPDGAGQEGDEFTLQSLSAQDRQAAEEIAQLATALVLKGMLNRMAPSEYPIAAAPDSLEAQAAALVRTVPVAVMNRLAPKLMTVARDEAKLAKIVGPGASLQAFKQPDIARAVPQFSRTLSRARPSHLNLEPEPARVRVVAGTQRNAQKYSRAHLVLRAVHCVRETSGGGMDEIILGGVLIGASGNVKAINAFDAGDYDTGTYANFGETFLGQYSLRTTNGYPKHLYAIFTLVESDSDDAEVAKQLTQTISFLASTIVSAFATPAAGVLVGSVLTAIGNFIVSFIGDDALRPYGIRLSLESEDHFGGFEGPKQHTGNITGDGAKYRIGYRWLLGA